MEDTIVSIVLTTECNLKCKYCVNNQGTDLIINKNNNIKWNTPEEIIKCLINISKCRDIRFVRFFGGEPTLKIEFIKEVVKYKNSFSSEKGIDFVFTTNAYKFFTEDDIKFFVDNNVKLSISLDGKEDINNFSRISRDGENCFKAVLNNMENLKKHNHSFSIMSVIDERLLKFNTTIEENLKFLYNFSPVVSLDPAYLINNENKDRDYINDLLQQERDFVDSVITSIYSLDIKNFIFENNISNTITNIFLNNTDKKYVCGAANYISIFPGNKAYFCYNLLDDRYLITNDISNIDSYELNNIINIKKVNLSMNNFSPMYKEVELYGDYCSKENNFNSFAYLYRKEMINRLKLKLNELKLGSPEHLSLITYINKWDSMIKTIDSNMHS